jgi:hypothetical protein
MLFEFSKDRLLFKGVENFVTLLLGLVVILRMFSRAMLLNDFDPLMLWLINYLRLLKVIKSCFVYLSSYFK